MANLTKLKRRNTLGAPPTLEEASRNLAAPETAPAHLRPKSRKAIHHQSRIDGRSLRRTGRTVQFATRVSLDFDDQLRRIAQRDGMKLVEVLEHALEAYESSRK